MKYVITAFAGLFCALVMIIMCMTVADMAHVGATAPQSEAKATDPIESIGETESVTEAVTEPHTEAETEAETIPEVDYYNVPLDEYMQEYIKAECKSKGISPSVVIAIIERESRFDQYAIGDDGRAFGLMQVLPKHHLDRMVRLGCTDLFQPYQNVTVGINYLAELEARYGDIEKAVVAYNSGSYSGTVTSYAVEVMARANELERGE